MNRRFKIVYYLLVTFFTLVFTYQIYQLATMFLHRPARHLVVNEDD